MHIPEEVSHNRVCSHSSCPVHGEQRFPEQICPLQSSVDLQKALGGGPFTQSCLDTSQWYSQPAREHSTSLEHFVLTQTCADASQRIAQGHPVSSVHSAAPMARHVPRMQVSPVGHSSDKPFAQGFPTSEKGFKKQPANKRLIDNTKARLRKRTTGLDCQKLWGIDVRSIIRIRSLP